ncbi:hypothetical protein [Demequina aurantiaca]|uniref:hypothetical protein n=1 Tax=Demequina aurantiaca TaxID=676200 RepID=UPI003D3555E9
MTELRRTSAGRFSGALWGILVAACGGLMIASFNGFVVDVQLVVILALCGLGLWLLLTALFASGARSRTTQRDPGTPTSADHPDSPADDEAAGDEANVPADGTREDSAAEDVPAASGEDSPPALR